MSLAGQRIGVLGGTFDPPHIGHLVAALEVRHALDLDVVLLVVANDPWHKPGGGDASPPGDRLAMVEAAVEGLPGLEASDLEVVRGGPSYTFDTLADLREGGGLKGGEPAELFLILGADAAAGLPGWHRASELPGLARLVVVDRPGAPEPDPPAGWSWELVVVPQLEVSSTALRERFRRGAPVELLTPPGVVEIVQRRGLYR